MLTRYLQATFGEEASAYATSVLTFQSLWTRLNRLQKRSFVPLPVPIRGDDPVACGAGPH